MFGDLRVYDADSHLLLTPAMWAELPAEYRHRRPRPLEVHRSEEHTSELQSH